ncbi:MAG: hypothetical protein ACI8R4_000133 [Paracoccaceae bacterium]|jgi:hypothetical protein
MMFHNSIVRFLAILFTLVLSAYLAFITKSASPLQFEGVAQYRWFIPAAAWTVGFAYVFVQIMLAMGWVYEANVGGLAQATSSWPKPIRDLMGIPDSGPIRK